MAEGDVRFRQPDCRAPLPTPWLTPERLSFSCLFSVKSKDYAVCIQHVSLAVSLPCYRPRTATADLCRPRVSSVALKGDRSAFPDTHSLMALEPTHLCPPPEPLSLPPVFLPGRPAGTCFPVSFLLLHHDCLQSPITHYDARLEKQLVWQLSLGRNFLSPWQDC